MLTEHKPEAAKSASDLLETEEKRLETALIATRWFGKGLKYLDEELKKRKPNGLDIHTEGELKTRIVTGIDGKKFEFEIDKETALSPENFPYSESEIRELFDLLDRNIGEGSEKFRDVQVSYNGRTLFEVKDGRVTKNDLPLDIGKTLASALDREIASRMETPPERGGGEYNSEIVKKEPRATEAESEPIGEEKSAEAKQTSALFIGSVKVLEIDADGQVIDSAVKDYLLQNDTDIGEVSFTFDGVEADNLQPAVRREAEERILGAFKREIDRARDGMGRVEDRDLADNFALKSAIATLPNGSETTTDGWTYRTRQEESGATALLRKTPDRDFRPIFAFDENGKTLLDETSDRDLEAVGAMSRGGSANERAAPTRDGGFEL